MSIEIDGIQFPRVHRLRTVEQAAFVYHRLPGQAGNSVQNLGRDSVCLQIEGIFYGPTAGESLEKLREIYLKRTAVDFVAELMGGAYAGKVTLDRLDVTQAAEAPDQFSYCLLVAEYISPPKPATNTALIDQKAKLEAKNLLDVATLPDALSLGSVPELTNPFIPLQSVLTPLQSATASLLEAVSELKNLLS